MASKAVGQQFRACESSRQGATAAPTACTSNFGCRYLYGYLEVRDWVERPIRPYFLSPIGAKGSGHKLRARNKYNPLAIPFHGWVMSLGWRIAHPTSR